ncbi:MAG: glycosyltransferase family 2 protein [Gammaproteobacteria bacterium]
MPSTVSAVIPARNEGPTIAGVIAPLVRHPLIGEVIVVDDGSTDDTAARARDMGACVISLPRNGGKGAAMSQGVRAARHDVILFCDADVLGLTPEKITRILAPILAGEYAMYVGIRGRRTFWANRLLHFTPILGGERALVKSLWRHVPRGYKKDFQIEIALNFFAKRFGYPMGFEVLPGLSQVIKERKRGLLPGLWQRLGMIADILLVSWRLYVVLQALLFARELARHTAAGDPALAPPSMTGRATRRRASRTCRADSGPGT